MWLSVYKSTKNWKTMKHSDGIYYDKLNKVETRFINIHYMSVRLLASLVVFDEPGNLKIEDRK